MHLAQAPFCQQVNFEPITRLDQEYFHRSHSVYFDYRTIAVATWNILGIIIQLTNK